MGQTLQYYESFFTSCFSKAVYACLGLIEFFERLHKKDRNLNIIKTEFFSYCVHEFFMRNESFINGIPVIVVFLKLAAIRAAAVFIQKPPHCQCLIYRVHGKKTIAKICVTCIFNVFPKKSPSSNEV